MWGGETSPNKLVRAFTLQEWNEVVINQKEMTVSSNQTIIKLKPNWNYYYTRNPMITAKLRGTDNLRGLSRIVIDIDNESNLNTYHADKERLLERLFSDLVERNEIPEPTEVVFSGRGIQLHYEIEQNATALTFLYNLVLNDLLDTIERYLERQDDLQQFNVDRTASNNHAGLVRLAGTNQKSALKIERNYIGNKYTIDTLMTILGTTKQKQKQGAQTLTNAPSKTKLNLLENNLLRGRIRQLEQLQAFRIDSKDTRGTRNKLNFLYLNSVVPIDPENAVARLHKFNNKYPNPTPAHELQAMINGIEGRGVYSFKKATFREWLELTPLETPVIALKKNPKRTVVRETQAMRKEAKIKSLLMNETKGNDEIAELMNTSVRTVQRWRKVYNLLNIK